MKLRNVLPSVQTDLCWYCRRTDLEGRRNEVPGLVPNMNLKRNMIFCDFPKSALALQFRNFLDMKGL
jgi:hypothetical protein